MGFYVPVAVFCRYHDGFPVGLYDLEFDDELDADGENADRFYRIPQLCSDVRGGSAFPSVNRQNVCVYDREPDFSNDRRRRRGNLDRFKGIPRSENPELDFTAADDGDAGGGGDGLAADP